VTTDESPPADHRWVRCTFVAFRGADVLFRRAVDLADVPRVGERVQIWFEGAGNTRGTVRHVRWSIPEAGAPVVTLQLELSPADRTRFARQAVLPRRREDAI
jgi:hypothetical protein